MNLLAIDYILFLWIFLFLFCLDSILGQCVNWVEVPSLPDESSYTSIAVDASGQYMLACIQDGYLYTSQDYGNTWIEDYDSMGPWYWVGMNGNGSAMYAVDGTAIYYSYDYGSSFTESVGSTIFSVYWYRVVPSTYGSPVYACGVSGVIYISTNAGVTWTPTNSPNTDWYGIAVNATGEFVAATGALGAFVSSDSGGTWQLVLPVFDTLTAISSDYTGQYLATVVYDGYIYVSQDFGQTWNLTGQGPFQYKTIASSSSGQILYAGTEGSPYFHISSDYGLTWYNLSVPPNPAASQNNDNTVSISSNAAASILGSVVSGGPVYVCTLAPTSQPSSQPSGQPSSYPSRQPTSCPTSQPTSVPTAQPSSQPSRLPTSQPTMQPSSVPSSQPTGIPSSKPTAIPTSFPTIHRATDHSYQFSSSLNSQGIPFVNATITQLGYDPTALYYLTVSFLQTGFGSKNNYYVNIKYGESQQTLCSQCSVNNECGGEFIDCAGCEYYPINGLIESAQGGSIYLVAEANLPWDYDDLCQGYSGADFIVQYDFTTTAPTPSSTTTTVNGLSLTNELAPIVISLVVAALTGIGGLTLSFLRRRDEKARENKVYQVQYLSSFYSFSVYGCSFVSQLFFAYACLSTGKYEMFGWYWLIVKICFLIFTAIFLTRKYYTIQDFQFDWEHFGRCKRMYTIVFLCTIVQPTFCRFLPWIENDITNSTGGFPTYVWYMNCSIIQAVESFALIGVQIAFASYFKLTTLSSFTRASLLVSVISTFLMGFVVVVELLLVKDGLQAIEMRKTRQRSGGVSLERFQVDNPVHSSISRLTSLEEQTQTTKDSE